MKKLVLGTAQLGIDYGINNKKGKPSYDEAFDILNLAYENNIRILDTASAYGESEKIIGSYMKKENREFKIATKLPKYTVDCSISEFVNNQVDRSLKNLKIQKINYYFIHNLSDILKQSNIFNMLIDLKKNGVIENIGISIYDVDEYEYIVYNLSNFIDIIQLPYNILDLRWTKNKLLSNAKEYEFEIFIRSVFLQGFLFLDKEKAEEIHAGAYKYLKQIKDFCLKKNIEISQIAIEYVKSQSFLDYLIVGCENTTQLKEIIHYFNYKDDLLQNEILEFALQNFANVEKEIFDPRTWSVK